MVAGGVVALVAFVLERRGRRSAALEARAARLAHDREAQARAAVAAERPGSGVISRTSWPTASRHDRARADGSPALLDEDPARAREPILARRADGPAGARRAAPPARHPARGGARPLAPQPGLEDLDGSWSARGRPACRSTLTVEGPPAALAPGVDLAAYRVVQDALTNALEQAGPAHARVAVRYGVDALDLEVTTTDEGETARGRHGLVGLRERVALYGGELEAGRAAAAASRSAYGSRSRRARRDPRPDRRRPGARARRLSHDPRRRRRTSRWSGRRATAARRSRGRASSRPMSFSWTSACPSSTGSRPRAGSEVRTVGGGC